MSTNNIMNNMNKIPSTKQVIQYYHAVAGFPTKVMWLKAINRGFLPHGSGRECNQHKRMMTMTINILSMHHKPDQEKYVSTSMI